MLNPSHSSAPELEARIPHDPVFLSERVEAFYREREINPVVGGNLLEGRIPGEDDILLLSNDYLSLAKHPSILAAQAEALNTLGHGVLRSAVFLFGDNPVKNLESALGRHMGGEDGLLSQSGWCANTGLIQSIADEATPVYLDMFAHMSLWEGVKSAGATPRPFRHNSADSLDKLIAKHGPGVVVVDSVYSTSGSVCPLAEIVEVGEQYGCVIVVDESHSLGVYGSKGEGMVEELGLSGRVHFRTSSLSKAFAARGGIIVGSARNIKYLRYRSLPAIFSSALLPHEIAGLQATLTVIRQESHRREKVLGNSAFLRNRLNELGYDVGADHSPIIALVGGAEENSILLRNALESRGVFGSPFCDPATPKNRSLIRFTVNADHRLEQLEQVVAVCEEIRGEVRMEEWPQIRKRSFGMN